MRFISLPEAEAHLDNCIEQSKESPVVVTRNGRPVAIIVGIEDEDDLDSLLLAHNQLFIKRLEEARQRVRVSGGIALDDMRSRLESLPEE